MGKLIIVIYFKISGETGVGKSLKQQFFFSPVTYASLEHQYHRPDFSAEYGVMDLQWQKSWEISAMEVFLWLLECKLAWLLLLLQGNFQKV